MDGTGDIICSLDELLLVAAEHWRTPLTQQDLARMSSLSRSTINELLPAALQDAGPGAAAAEPERGTAERGPAAPGLHLPADEQHS